MKSVNANANLLEVLFADKQTRGHRHYFTHTVCVNVV